MFAFLKTAFYTVLFAALLTLPAAVYVTTTYEEEFPLMVCISIGTLLLMLAMILNGLLGEYYATGMDQRTRKDKEFQDMRRILSQYNDSSIR